MDRLHLVHPSPSTSHAAGSPICLLQNILKLGPFCWYTCFPAGHSLCFKACIFPAKTLQWRPVALGSKIPIPTQSVSCPPLQPCLQLTSFQAPFSPSNLPVPFLLWDLAHASSTPSPVLPFTSLRSLHKGHLSTCGRWMPSHPLHLYSSPRHALPPNKQSLHFFVYGLSPTGVSTPWGNGLPLLWLLLTLSTQHRAQYSH